MDSSGDIMRLCRLCLVKEQVNIPIFEDQGDIRQIFLKISSCLPVKVSRDDNLPKKICDGCSGKLDLLYDFWNTSANAEKTLLSWLGEAGIKEQDVEDKLSAVQQMHHESKGIVKQETVDPTDANFFSNFENSFDEAPTKKITKKEKDAQPPPPKRARRTAAVKAQINISRDSDDDDDLDATEPLTKIEDESDSDADPSYGEVPGTSADDQPGPSGMSKDGVEAPTSGQINKDGEDEDEIADEARNKRAIAILLGVSEIVEEEIRASTPKADPPAIGEDAATYQTEENLTEAGKKLQKDSSESLAPTESSIGSSKDIVETNVVDMQTQESGGSADDCNKINDAEEAEKVSEQIYDREEVEIENRKIEEPTDDMMRGDPPIEEETAQIISEQFTEVSADDEVRLEKQVVGDPTDVSVESTGTVREAAPTETEHSSEIYADNSDEVTLEMPRNEEATEEADSSNSGTVVKSIEKIDDRECSPHQDEPEETENQKENVVSENNVMTNVAEPEEDASDNNTTESGQTSKINEDIDTVACTEEGEVNDMLSTSLTEILNDDLIHEIDEILQLNVSGTDDEIENKKVDIVFDKKLVVLVQKMRIKPEYLNIDSSEDTDQSTDKLEDIGENIENFECIEKDQIETIIIEDDSNEETDKATQPAEVEEVEMQFEENLEKSTLEGTSEDIEKKDHIRENETVESNTDINTTLSSNDECMPPASNDKVSEKLEDTDEDVEITDDGTSKNTDLCQNTNTTEAIDVRNRPSRCYCEVCSLLFSDPRQYWNHRYLSHDNHDFACPLCERKFKQVSSLIHHTKFRHAESFKQSTGDSDETNIMFYCESCGEGFSDVYSRLAHIQKFHEDKYILCHCCHLSFSNIDDLVFHAKRHQIYKDTNYTCKTCNRTIFFLSNFLAHIKKHNLDVETSFVCKVCKYKTKEFKPYKVHMLTHRKFRCSICPQKFTSKAKYMSHRTRSHNKMNLKKHFIDRRFFFGNHVKGRRLYTLKLLKKKSGDLSYTFQKVIPKSFAYPNQTLVSKITRLWKIKSYKDKFQALMKKLMVPNVPEIKKILYVKLIRYNEIKPKRKKITKKRFAPIHLRNDASTEEIVENIVDDASVESAEESTSVSETPESTFKKPSLPAPKLMRKKTNFTQSKTTGKSDNKKDESSAKFEPGKTAADAQGVQKSTELSSYKIPKKEKPMPKSRKFDYDSKSRKESKTTVLTGVAKNMQDAKGAGTDRAKKSRFEPLPVEDEEQATVAQTSSENKTDIQTPIVSKGMPVSDPAKKLSGQIPTIINKSIENTNEKKYPQNRQESFNRNMPMWNAPRGPPQFGNNQRFPNQPPRFREPFGNNLSGPNQPPRFREPFGNNMPGPNQPPQFRGPFGNNMPGPLQPPQFRGPFGNNMPGPNQPPQFRPPFGNNMPGPNQPPQFQEQFGNNMPGPNQSPQFRPPFGNNMPGPNQPPQFRPPFGNNMPGPNQPPQFRPTFANNMPGPNQPQQFIEQFGNNMAWETAAQNLLAQSFGTPQPNMVNENQGLMPSPQGMPPFGGPNFQPFQGPPRQGPQQFGPHEGPFGPGNFPGSPQTFNAPPSFDQVQEEPMDIEPAELICNGCKKEFPSPKVLELHTIFCNKLPALADSQLVCPVCAKTFEKRTVLKQHMFILHSKLFSKFNLILGVDLTEKYKCKSCTQVFDTKQDKEAHEQTHIFLDAFNAVKVKQSKSATITAPPALNKPGTSTASPSTSSTAASMTKEQLAESAKKALKQIQSPAFRMKLEQQKKQLKINLQYLKQKKSPSVTSAPELQLKTAHHPVSAPLSFSKATASKGQKSSGRRSRSFSPKGKSFRRRSRSASPKIKTSRRKSRSVSPKEKPLRKKSRSISPSAKRNRRRSRSRSKSPQSSRRNRSRERARLRKSRSTSRGRDSSKTVKELFEEERSQSPLRSRPKPKLNPKDAAYRCSKCAMLFSNFRDFTNHQESHEDSDDEESYLSLLDCPPPPPIAYGSSSAGSSLATYSCVVCLKSFKSQQIKDSHFCSGPF